MGMARPLPLLVELGLPGKRAGCRSADQALAVARAVAAAPGLQLAGIEGYEGLLTATTAQPTAGRRRFRRAAGGAGARADEEQLFGARSCCRPAAPPTSTWSRAASAVGGCRGRCCRAAQRLLPDQRPRLLTCAMISELDAREGPLARRRPAAGAGGVEHGAVASRADAGDPDMGKRDASYDIDLPIPLLSHRPGPRRPPASAAGRLQHFQDERPARLPALPPSAHGGARWRWATWSAAAFRTPARPSTSGRCCWRWTTITTCSTHVNTFF
jgi:D-serine dehydratase